MWCLSKLMSSRGGHLSQSVISIEIGKKAGWSCSSKRWWTANSSSFNRSTVTSSRWRTTLQSEICSLEPRGLMRSVGKQNWRHLFINVLCSRCLCGKRKWLVERRTLTNCVWEDNGWEKKPYSTVPPRSLHVEGMISLRFLSGSIHKCCRAHTHTYTHTKSSCP